MWARVGDARSAGSPARIARVVTVVTTALFWLIATSWRPWRLFAHGGFSADFYDEQARAFLRGRLAVDPAVAGIEGFLVDDRTYLYFGPALSVVRMPLAIAGDWTAGRLTLVSMLIALVVACTWAYRLLGLAMGRVAGRELLATDRWRTLAWMGAVAGSPLLALAGWISVYHETELWACALAIVAAVKILEFSADPSTCGVLPAAAATVATVLTRASVGIGVSVALIVVAALVWRRAPRQAGAAVVAAIAGVAAHMSLNFAKFGTLLSLPAERQVLTLLDPERAAWFAQNQNSFFSLQFLPTTVLHYLRLDTVRFERLVPGIGFGPPAHEVGGARFETITPAASLTAAAPVLVVLAILGAVLLVRDRRWDWAGVTVGLMIGAVPSFTIGFIANRYLVDMLPALIVPAAAGLVMLGRPRWLPDRAVPVLVVLAVTWSIWVNAALGTWILGLKSPGFTELRYRLDSLVFPTPSPGLTVIDNVSGVGRDGLVAIEADCAGVYIAEQGTWVALERSSNRVTVGRITFEDSGRVAEGDGWWIDLVGPGDLAVFELFVEGVSVAALEAGRVQSGTVLEVVADPVIPQFSIGTADRTVFFNPSVLAIDGRLRAPGLGDDSETRPTTPLCDLLQSRLDRHLR
jgi:hypothetical protein